MGSGATTASASTALAERALAPDLARGGLLLFIAIANSSWYLWGGDSRDLSGWPLATDPADLIVQSVSLIAIDGRSYPMFAALFGYGMWQLYSRQLAAGSDHRRAARLLRTRHLWMLAFGFVHAALLWGGDILGAYGLAGLLVGALFLTRTDRTIRRWIAVFTTLVITVTVVTLGAGLALAVEGFGEDGTYSSVEQGLGIAQPAYLVSIVERVVAWTSLTIVQVALLAVPLMMLIAIRAARARVLEEPREHRALLRRTAIIGVTVGWLGGVPTAAQNLDLLDIPSSLDWMFAGFHAATGLAGGLGYVAVFGLVAARVTEPGLVLSAIRAMGSRSLTFYLAQSLAFAPVMSAWGLGLGEYLSSWSIVLYAAGVWTISVVIAGMLGRRDIRGPAETLLRKLTYRATGTLAA